MAKPFETGNLVRVREDSGLHLGELTLDYLPLGWLGYVVLNDHTHKNTPSKSASCLQGTRSGSTRASWSKQMSDTKVGTMLVRVYYDGSTTGEVTTWGDGWPMSLAMTDWLTGEEWFEILAYYPDDTLVGSLVVEQNFIDAERRHAPCLSE